MIELKAALEQVGWELSSQVGSAYHFQATDDQTTWEILNTKTSKKTVLIFYLPVSRNRRTEQLSDSLYIEETSKRSRLYFEKLIQPTGKYQ